MSAAMAPLESRRTPSPWLGFAALLLWALLLQGSRALFEPDEGFYTNAAINMVRSGDWVVPRLDNGPFLDKPPFAIWSIAAGVVAFGSNEWGARAAHALWFALTALLVGGIAATLLGPAARWRASIAYALMLLPYAAGNVVTPDTPLALWAALATWAYLRSRERPGWAYPLLCGLAVAGGTLTKGPAMWMLAAPLALDRLFERRRPWLPDIAAAAVALAVGLSWYAAVVRRLPDAAAYFLDNQVTGRLISSTYARHPGLAGALIYVPVLLLGALPFSPAWIGQLRSAFRRRLWRGLLGRPAERFVAFWLLLPLGVLLAAQSRLPLYALPLCAPLAVLAVWPTERQTFFAAPWKRRAWITLGVWACVLLGVRAATALLPLEENARLLADALAAVEPDRTTPVVLLETKRHGLALYGWQQLLPAVKLRNNYRFYTPAPRFDELLRTLGPRHVAVILNATNRPVADHVLRAARWSCRATPGPFDYVFLICDPPAAAARPPG